MSKQVTVGLWQLSYPSDDEARILIGGMKGESFLVSIDVTNVSHILENLESDAPLIVEAVEMKPQTIIDVEGWDGETYERFNYELHDDNLSEFTIGEKHKVELLFPEPTDREWFADMLWKDPVIDALMWKVDIVAD